MDEDRAPEVWVSSYHGWVDGKESGIVRLGLPYYASFVRPATLERTATTESAGGNKWMRRYATNLGF